MIVLDTHVWLWLFADPERLSERARASVRNADRLGISAMTCWEAVMLHRLGRIELDDDPSAWVARALAHEHTELLPVTANIAVGAALLPGSFPGDPADRMIYATAREHGVPLLTKDRFLRGFDPSRAVW